jgi:DNA-binding PadR family transcriptional regulator
MTAKLTLPDLVVLSLLAERPMHGYELNRELEEREVRDWAGISRPQVYYSLRKLAEAGQLAVSSAESAAGPERMVYRLTSAGRRGLARALARDDWATQRPPPAFLTWLVLSIHADPADRTAQIVRRRAFLAEQLARERATLASIREDHGPMAPVAALVVELVIRQWEIEVEWLDRVQAWADPGLVQGTGG